MSFGPANDAKEQIRQSIDIVDLVGGYIQLRRQGRNYVGICPWHDDSRPSLNVNQQRQSWKCWVCDVGGDIFSFVMKAEGLEFREALELLAEKAGVNLRPQPVGGGAQSSAGSEKKRLLDVMSWAEEQFHRCLLESPEAEVARRYLVDRGLTAETVRKFHLGFSPNRWDWLLERARAKQFHPKLLERAGLAIPRNMEDGHYDRFRGRVLFSIRDTRSRPIAFGGRVLPQFADERTAKYINSPETPLFSKSRELYGLDAARDGIAREKQVVVLEGYTDCLMAHQHGLTNMVAVLGTALGEAHLQVLRRFTDSIVLVLDGDDAGRRRTNEIIDALLALFVKNQIDLRILTLPEGLDPCDFIASQGSEAFRHLLAGAVDALEHKFRSVTHGLDLTTDTHRATEAVEQVLGTLAQLRAAAAEAASPTLLREQQMLGRISREFHLPEEQLRNRLTALRKARQSRPAQTRRDAAESPIPAERPEPLSSWDRDLLALVLLDPSYITRIEAAPNRPDFSSTVARRIYRRCVELSQNDEPVEFNRLLLEFDDPEAKSTLVSLDEFCHDEERHRGDRELWIQDLLHSAARRRAEDERRHLLAAAKSNQDDAEALLARFYEQARPKQLSDYERRKK
ncbi:MAG: DNA primase [Pirellulales bacterium]